MFTPNNDRQLLRHEPADGCCVHRLLRVPRYDEPAALIYANQPYAAYSTGCTSGERPNNNAADDTINVTSHEHNEAITDPHLNAWWDDFAGNETPTSAPGTSAPHSAEARAPSTTR